MLLTEIRSEDDFVQTLAVKWLHERHSGNTEVAGRLRDEARLLGLLAHPHIVRVQGLTTIDGRLAVLMEPIAGVDLAGRTVPPAAARDVIRAAADALDAAWSTIPAGREEPLRVVHRDIKPSNLMVTPRGEVKVMDFGVARATFESREVQTHSQQYGTARYMAPERWLDGIAEAPSDVYSLGVTLVELLSGEGVPRARLSRQGFEEDVEAWMERLGDSPLVPLLRRMLAFEPADRPSAREVMTALDDLALEGPDLRTWAQTLTLEEPPPSPLTGTFLAEDGSEPDARTFPLDTTTATASTDGRSPTGTAPTQGLTTALPALPPEPPLRRRNRWWWLLLPAPLLLWWLLPDTPGPRLTEAAPVQSQELTSPPGRPAPVQPEPTVVEPTVVQPEPTVVQPGPPPPPRPVPRATPVPPEPVPLPPAEPEARTPVILLVQAGVRARTPDGELQEGRQALLLPEGELLRIDGRLPDDRAFGCTLPVGRAASTWQIRADGTCVRR